MKKILLIASNCLSKSSNNGKTVASLLSQFGQNNIRQIYFSFNETPDFDLCHSYYRLSDIDIMKGIFKKNCGHIIRRELTESEVKANKRNYIVNYGKKLLTPFMRDAIWYFSKWKSPMLMQWIYEFAPDVIFFVGGYSWFSNNIAVKLSVSLNIPLVSYYTDDYVLYSIPQNPLSSIIKKRRIHIYKRTISHSHLRYVIGEEMASAYNDYWHKEFIPIMNSVDIYPYQPKNTSEKLAISYFGGLHLYRWKSIALLAKLLPKNCNINIYTQSDITEEISIAFSTLPNVNFCGSVYGTELIQSMQNSDMLLHIESNDKYYRRLTKLSVSTKIPEYLISSRPILAFGPTEVASIKLLKDNNIGYVVDIDGTESLIKEQLAHIYQDRANFAKVSLKGYNYAITKFDKKKISEMVFNQICSICRDPK